MRLQSTILPVQTSYLVGIIALILAAAAAYFTFGSTSERPAEIFGVAATDTFAGATRITVRDGKERVTLSRESDRWVVAEKDGYPARQEDVAALLRRLRDPSVLREILEDAGGRSEIGVGSEEGSWNQRIVIESDGGGELELIVGTVRSAPGSQDMTAMPVRRAGSDRVWLVDADLRAPAKPMDWIDPQILAVPRTQISELRTLPVSGEPVVLKRPSPEATNLEPANLPDDDTAIEPGAATGPAGAFTRLVFDDVRRADRAAPPDDGETGQVRTLAGTVVTYWFEEIDGSTWARFGVDRAEVSGDDETTESQAVAGVWTPRHVDLRDWAFRLPDYASERLRRGISDLPSR